jgi:hypothetical protein
MHCPKCGKENPEAAQVCSACNSPLPGVSAPAERPITKTSGLAIVAFVLGILSIFSCAITAIPAIVLGIISFVRIEKSGGRLTGENFAVLGIVVPVIVILILGILLPALARVRQIDLRTTCGKNLSDIGKTMTMYANDYGNQFPRAGGPGAIWQSRIGNWRAEDRFTAFGLEFGGTGGRASISSSFYLLVKYYEVTPKTFVCKADRGTKEFKAEKYIRDRELVDLWDFGPEPWKHCSYVYHMPYGPYALTTASEPGLAVAADRSPWLATHKRRARDFSRFKFDGGLKQQKAGNSPVHEGDGQNVLFMDSHVYFEKRAYCGLRDDNIYTFWNGSDIRQGAPPVLGSQPEDKRDSLLVHDPPMPDKR